MTLVTGDVVQHSLGSHTNRKVTTMLKTSLTLDTARTNTGNTAVFATVGTRRCLSVSRRRSVASARSST